MAINNKGVHSLKIDKEFKNLIRPLLRKEYLQLEENLIMDGCLDPIITWNGVIIDGHNRYEICQKHHIPFAVTEKTFANRDAAIAWICAHQLGRRNITEETRKFLIGRQYESEKRINVPTNIHGNNQYFTATPSPAYEDDLVPDPPQPPSRHVTAQRIADENHISFNTVQKYAAYSRALEIIGEKVPEMQARILSGRFKISHKNILELAALTPEQIRKVGAQLEKTQKPFTQYKSSRGEIQSSITSNELELKSGPSVKDMPAFDPDAEVTGLTLTIPSWASSISRTHKKTDLGIVSERAKQGLVDALLHLMAEVQEMLNAIKED